MSAIFALLVSAAVAFSPHRTLRASSRRCAGFGAASAPKKTGFVTAGKKDLEKQHDMPSPQKQAKLWFRACGELHKTATRAGGNDSW